ncbi:hypothetical protein AB0M43_37560 [Longispora sp. NPDC051575]|uniref:SLOG cluster 4 domain-containing protein n=1 Tax=Longispora sp. NPDC051575 TaxID=3154943 RepID=UPI0034125006
MLTGLGQLTPKPRATVICGGAGVMKAHSAGAANTAATSSASHPNDNRDGANEHLSAVIVTGMAEARNVHHHLERRRRDRRRRSW